ncbi:GDSL esterase/lipase At4g10955 [Punica granatum]|nr:GDSL esterase/lipase At4g10955 [Punica granatum]XP_031392887.1 GDSL esterase/lipase At4g10955 [Punica granatum]XP_031392888.1 GDSL esterase/lipase At4g10955 [Punica granatum]XP_031392889.1 GDSL esterase/lipase At4g10955 [Punica granatum]PKI51751.1 hypothetical protein CRG98_027914 [Punica granatum]
MSLAVLISEREQFDLSGPLDLTSVDWNDPHHRRSVAACLVQGVYILERDRQEKREGPHALAPPWWEFFQFKLVRPLIDDIDCSIFGAIYEYSKSPTSPSDPLWNSPQYVIAFRGTVTKKDSISQDILLDLHFVQNKLHQASRAEAATQAVRCIVAASGPSRVWLAGHSLGSAIAMITGKNMAKSGVLLESFLFNPPYFSVPIERIKNQKVKYGIRFASSLITAGLSLAVKGPPLSGTRSLEDPFAALAAWVPNLFVNRDDHICAEYVGYFEHRKKMEQIGAGAIERLASQHSMGTLIMNAKGNREAEALHLIPSANLTVNTSPSEDFKAAHGIHQWWRLDLDLQSKLYMYS